MSACLRCLLKSKLEVGEPREWISDPNPEKREGREKEEDLGALFFFPLNLMVFIFLIKASTLNVPFILLCYEGSTVGDHQKKAFVSQATFSTPLCYLRTWCSSSQVVLVPYIAIWSCCKVGCGKILQKESESLLDSMLHCYSLKGFMAKSSDSLEELMATQQKLLYAHFYIIRGEVYLLAPSLPEILSRGVSFLCFSSQWSSA